MSSKSLRSKGAEQMEEESGGFIICWREALLGAHSCTQDFFVYLIAVAQCASQAKN